MRDLRPLQHQLGLALEKHLLLLGRQHRALVWARARVVVLHPARARHRRRNEWRDQVKDQPERRACVLKCTRASWPVLPQDPAHANAARTCLLRAGSSLRQSTHTTLRRQTLRAAATARSARGGRAGAPRRVHRTCGCRGVRWVLGWFLPGRGRARIWLVVIRS